MPTRITLKDELAWRYAQLAMADMALSENAEKITRKHFMVRAKFYKGLRTGTMHIGSFFSDEKAKMKLHGCAYCGCCGDLSLDHVIPRKKMGLDLSENLLPVCKNCNSSKGEKDLLSWMLTKGKFPSVLVLRRYLKLIHAYCVKNEILDLPLTDCMRLALPFELAQLTCTLDMLSFPLSLKLTETVPHLCDMGVEETGKSAIEQKSRVHFMF